MGAFRVKRPGPLRRRRGVEALEFALVFPIFFLLFFGFVEFSWMSYQSASVKEAARVGCRAAGQMSPTEGGYELEASRIAQAELQRISGINCNSGSYTCITSFPLDASTFAIPRLVCDFEVSYVSLTGILDAVGASPEFLRGRSATIFEGAEL